MKKLKYSQTLQKYMQGFVNKNETDKEHAFTKGVFFYDDYMAVSDRHIYIEFYFSNISKEFKNRSFNENEEIVDTDFNTIQFLKLKQITRPNTYRLDYNKWEAAREKMMKRKRPKSYGNYISPNECVKLEDGLVVNIREFDKVVKLCRKYDISFMKYNQDTFMFKKDQITIIGVVYQNQFFNTDDVTKIEDFN